MEKAIVVKELIRLGYDAREERGVVVVLCPDRSMDMRIFTESVLDAFSEMGYSDSWRCKYEKIL